MLTKGRNITHDYLSETPPVWGAVGELLETGQYERVVELLNEALAAGQQTGDGVNGILVAARQICLMCSQCRAATDWHRQAAEEAGRREQELVQQLQAMLALVNGREPSQTPAAPANKTETPAVLPGENGPHPAQVSPSLLVYCLGPFRVVQNDQVITAWNSLKSRSIFKYLVAHHGTPVAKDILMDVFWPDADPEAARRNLHQAIYSLRQTLRQGRPDFQPVQFEHDRYLLNPELDIWLDYAEFEKHVKAGRRLERADQPAEAEVEYSIAGGYYEGDFLEEDLYEDWPIARREYFRSMYLDLANRLSDCYIRQARHSAAIALGQKILAYNNFHEETHRRLMQCYLIQGQRGLALQQYHSCVQALEANLDVPPSAETQALYEQIAGRVSTFEPAELEPVPF